MTRAVDWIDENYRIISVTISKERSAERGITCEPWALKDDLRPPSNELLRYGARIRGRRKVIDVYKRSHWQATRIEDVTKASRSVKDGLVAQRDNIDT